MTRTLTAGMVTAAQAQTGEVFYLLDLSFSGGVLYITTASNTVVWNSNTYLALGGHLAWEPIAETPALSDQQVRLTLDGVDTTVITKILQQNHIGRTAIIRMAHFGTDGAIVADPVSQFTGLMNAPFNVSESSSEKGGGTTKVSTVITSPVVYLNRRSGIQSNSESHGAVYSGDTFWRHLHAITSKDVYWGQSIPVSSGGGGSGFDEDSGIRF